ncbi:MAG: hypothetical protein KA035_01850 [Candidatus Levybacteria bacterium]|nr:hypothetical protein [Candidatus Levybacteria bacterium]
MSQLISSLDKKAILILTLEIGIVLIVLFCIALFFNFFKIFPFNETAPKPSQPQKQSIQKSINISTISNIPGYEFKLENKDELIKLLTNWNIIGNNSTNETMPTGNTPVKNITFRLEELRQPDTTSSSSAIPSQSEILTSSNGIEYNLFLTTDQLESNVYRPQVLLSIILSRLYFLANTPNDPAQITDSRMKITQAQTMLESIHPIYFSIISTE